jgi:hypothetical protein
MRDNQWIVARNQPDTAIDSQKADAKNPTFQLEVHAIDTTVTAVSNQLHRQLVDFDTHLASVGTDNIDWLRNDKIIASLSN